jgi:hypothetical protein
MCGHHSTRDTRLLVTRAMHVACGATAGLCLTAMTAAAQIGPPVRPLPRAAATTTEPLASTSQVRALPGGRVLLNDATRRRLLLFDSTLTQFKVIADSAVGSPSPYGAAVGTLLRYRGDSSLLLDASSLSMLVIDPEGQIVRVRAIPRSQDASRIANIYTGIDAEGRIIYRGVNPLILPSIPQGGGIAVPEQPDSIAVVRIDLNTRKLDTAALVRAPKSSMIVSQSPSGGMRISSRQHPLPMLDEWTVTSDGRIALVRGRDYHVDWVNPDGSITSSPKMPFDWQRLEEKQAYIDSVRTAREKQREQSLKFTQTRYDSLMELSRKTGSQPPEPLPPLDQMYPPIQLVDADELPDYKPPFGPNAVRADADGNVWIRTNPMKPTPGGPVYDIVNGNGELVDRVQIAASRTLVGFGPGGIVYVGVRDPRGVRLERVRLNDPVAAQNTNAPGAAPIARPAQPGAPPPAPPPAPEP